MLPIVVTGCRKLLITMLGCTTIAWNA